MSNMVINTNVLALNAHRNGKNVGITQSRASARLSSGLKINSAADDAAGLAISEKMRAQIRGLDMASKNAQDGISLLQTAEGGMQEIDNMIQRIRELTVQAANDTNNQTDGDRTNIQDEITALLDEIDAMSNRVEFNGKTLLDGSFDTDPLVFQVGANSGADQRIEVKINSMDTTTLGIDAVDVDKTLSSDISDQLDDIDDALKLVTTERSKLGAAQNRLEYTMKSLDISSENLSAAESRIRDTDMAKEMMNLTKANVLQQAANSMLAQANQAPQAVLQLLR